MSNNNRDVQDCWLRKYSYTTSGIHLRNAQLLPPHTQSRHQLHPKYSCTDLLEAHGRKGTIVWSEQLRIAVLLFAIAATMTHSSSVPGHLFRCCYGDRKSHHNSFLVLSLTHLRLLLVCAVSQEFPLLHIWDSFRTSMPKGRDGTD